ncbi:hypothetical protein K3495_g4578 [Podosphaera aphanis]|nr:hypothetical protein K3495_g4578 [Podosphaera aphanis]
MQKLLGTNRPLTDKDLLDRIVVSILEIPAEKVNWHGAAYQVKSQKLTLKQALPVFREADKMTSNASITANSTSANLAETSHSSRDNGNRGRGTRGATRHFSGRLEDFSGLKRWSSPRHVSTADGNTCTSEGYGVCKIGYLTLKDVWYVPAFKNIKLISVGALNKDGISVIFENGTATAKKSEKIMFEASTHDNLYQIFDEDLSLEPIQQRSLAAYQSGSTMRNVPIPIDEMSRFPTNDAELWHFRLAHASYKTISRLPNIPRKPKVCSNAENACEACLAGKLRETYSKKTDNRTAKIAWRLHAGISGKLPTSMRGYNYFLIIIDDASRCGFIRLLKNKSTAGCLPMIKEIVAHLQLKTGERAVFFTADNGSGEVGQDWKDWCRELGVKVQPSPPYKHSLNGVAERAIGFLVQLAKSMIFHAQLNWKLCWCYAIVHAMHIRNRLPTTALPFGPENTRPGSNITSVTAFSGKEISLKKLRVLGCAPFPLIYKETRAASSKLAANADADWIFVGIQSNTIWILLNRKTWGEQRSVDCEFREHIFPGLAIKDSVTDAKALQNIPYRVSMNSDPSDNRVARDSGQNLQDRNDQVSESSSNEIENQVSREKCDESIPTTDNTHLLIITRSGKVAGTSSINQTKKGFDNSAALMVKVFNAIHIGHREESTSLSD